MNRLLLSAVSAAAILVSTDVFADHHAKHSADKNAVPDRTAAQSDTNTVTQEEIKKGWDKTKEAVSSTAKDVGDAAEDAYEATADKTKEIYNDVKSAIKDDNEVVNVETVQVNPEAKVSSLIDMSLQNTDGKEIGVVQDLIIDQDGAVKMVVLDEGQYFGLGKTVAFDYSVIQNRTKDGAIVAPLTQDAIDTAAPFTYERKDASAETKVMPANGYSMNKILDGDITDPKNTALASIDDAVITNGKISHFIIGYGKTLGLGGKQAVLSFDDVSPTVNDGVVNFQLNVEKAARFEVYKKSSLN